MNTSTNNSDNNSSLESNKLTKKTWAKPDFYLIDTDNIRGGGNAGINENNITRSVTGNAVGKSLRPFILYTGGGKSYYAANSKSAYNS